jgi:hypothetical protein
MAAEKNQLFWPMIERSRFIFVGNWISSMQWAYLRPQMNFMNIKNIIPQILICAQNLCVKWQKSWMTNVLQFASGKIYRTEHSFDSVLLSLNRSDINVITLLSLSIIVVDLEIRWKIFLVQIRIIIYIVKELFSCIRRSISMMIRIFMNGCETNRILCF